MYFHICTKWSFAAFVIVDCCSCHNCPGTQFRVYVVFAWKAIQKTVLYIILTISRCGYFSKGKVLIVDHVLSFMVWMYLSTSGTCSSWAVMLCIMPSCSWFFWCIQNCQLANTCLTLKPLELYESMICLSDVIMVDFFLFFIISAVPKCIEHEVVIIDGMVLFIYMMSIASVTVLWRSYSLVGMLSNVLICTLDGVVLVVSLLVILGWVQVFILHYIYIHLEDRAVG